MEHNDVRHMLSEYLDNTVTAEEKSSIEEHVKTCTLCSDALNELRKTIEHIKTVEEVDPPAWMTQKIMAKVRSEAEKRNPFQRLFYPLSIKLPIQTVAVLFLAVTAFYIYRSIQPVSILSETPMQSEKFKEEAKRRDIEIASPPARNDTRDKLAKSDDSSGRAKQVPQTPEYKALDMKPEYEKPASPVPESQAGAPALAPAKSSEQFMPAKKGAALERHTAAPQAGAPAMLQEQATGAATRAEKKRKSAALPQQAVTAVSSDKTGPLIIVHVKNVEAAAREVEQAITRLGGSITRKENIEEKKVFIARINAQKLSDLKNKLKLIGEVKDETVALRSQDGQVELKIELVLDSVQP